MLRCIKIYLRITIEFDIIRILYYRNIEFDVFLRPSCALVERYKPTERRRK